MTAITGQAVPCGYPGPDLRRPEGNGRAEKMTSRRVMSRAEGVDGAVRHFVRNGGLDMEELAAELAVSRATLYRVAGSRDALLGEALWAMGRWVLDRCRAERTAAGADGVIEVSRNYARKLATAEPIRRFLGAEPQTAARVLLTPAATVHREAVSAQHAVFLEAGLPPGPCLRHRATLYVGLMESVLYGEQLGGDAIAFEVAEPALRALITR